MRKIISLHIGQGGVQLGNSYWELFYLEYGVKYDGLIKKEIKNQEEYGEVFKFFLENKEGNYSPRSLFIDSESKAVQKVKYGANRGLFRQNQFIYGKEQASNNFASGHYQIGKLEQENQLKIVHINKEQFIQFNSGLGALLLERFSDDYSKQIKMGINQYLPISFKGTALVEPYNIIKPLMKFLIRFLILNVLAIPIQTNFQPKFTLHQLLLQDLMNLYFEILQNFKLILFYLVFILCYVLTHLFYQIGKLVFNNKKLMIFQFKYLNHKISCLNVMIYWEDLWLVQSFIEL
ncbi:unnamed protein product [Paramecium primaurelia]|uniref:Tubulin/FtsZ GTPase domain-containing protein n=1 Tax=Paramecium primaurelia TaxID=5886 RepID=A0A8S1QS77_PARPR|nr:unnamed protein product [Paramecium primaurelia]